MASAPALQAARLARRNPQKISEGRQRSPLNFLRGYHFWRPPLCGPLPVDKRTCRMEMTLFAPVSQLVFRLSLLLFEPAAVFSHSSREISLKHRCRGKQPRSHRLYHDAPLGCPGSLPQRPSLRSPAGNPHRPPKRPALAPDPRDQS